tara:strand:+ start:89 stop:1636 length:1548 start_codon:yes stop_codon:yes gene_type:complete
METTEVINIGKEGAARTIDYDISNEPWYQSYQEMLTIFLRQGSVVRELSMQVSGDDLRLTLIGRDDNLLYMKVKNFFAGKTRPPFRGDFVLHSNNGNRANNILSGAELRTHMDAVMAAQSSNPSYSISDIISTASLTSTDNSRYNRQTVTSDTFTGTPRISMGLTSMAIPIRTLRQILSSGKMQFVKTNSGTQQRSRMMMDALRNQLTEGLELPLVLHGHPDSQSGYGWNSIMGDLNLLSRSDGGIVYEVPNHPLVLTKIKLLCSLDTGSIKRALSKTAKKRPFGVLELHYDSEKNSACLKVKNLTGEPGEKEFEEVKIKTKQVNILYTTESGKSVASSNYGTIFDTFLSSRRGNPSLASANNRHKENYPNDTMRELIGISETGNMVLGFESQHLTIMCTASVIKTDAEVDDEYLGETKPRPLPTISEEQMTDRLRQVMFATLEEVADIKEKQNTLNSSTLYMKWKIYSDEWHLARGISPLPKEVGPVFMTYMNSGEVQQEDIDEYNRLLQEEEE